MVPTPQQVEFEQRRAKEEERNRRDTEWRENTRIEDLHWRTSTRDEDVVWRQSVRTEDMENRARDLVWRGATRDEDVAYRQRETDWRGQIRAEDVKWRDAQLENHSAETRSANRRYALLAASQSLKAGSEMKVVLKLAANYVAWIESTDKAAAIK
jgi:hypothetical protein